MNIHPVNDQILIEQITGSNRTKSGIVLPERRLEKNELENRVVAVGPGRRGFTDQLLPMPCKVGDVIHAFRNTGTPVTIDGKEYRYIDSNAVFAVVGEGIRVTERARHVHFSHEEAMMCEYCMNNGCPRPYDVRPMEEAK